MSGNYALDSHSGEELGTVVRLVEVSGFEPLTPCLQSRCSAS